jgi:hypothetical protein
MALTFGQLREANRVRDAEADRSACDWMIVLVAALGDVAYLIRKHEQGSGSRRPDAPESAPPWCEETGLPSVTIPKGLDPTLILWEHPDDGAGTAITAPQAIAEVMICLDRLAAHLDVDLGAAVRDRFNMINEEHGFITRLEE